MAYRVTLRASAEKSLTALPKSVRRRAIEKIRALSVDPRPPGCVKLSGRLELWRVRAGDYRIVYHVNDEGQVVDIRVVAHRRESYRGL